MTNAEKTPYRRIEIHHGKRGIHGERGQRPECLTFRVFRVFRGSCCFRGFRAFRGSVLFIAVLALFLFAFAASPAHAQSPATLLDIKNPSGESLLTIDDTGTLWIKGGRHNCTSETITLDPNIDYWAIRDTTGKILLALDTSTGDLYTAGTLVPWSDDPDQANAVLRYTNSNNQVVFTVGSSGETRSANSLPSSLPNVPDFDELLVWENLGIVFPAANPRGRFFCWVPEPPADGSLYDVTDISWRMRWDSAKTNLADYGISPMFYGWYGLLGFEYKPPYPNPFPSGPMKLHDIDIYVWVGDTEIFPILLGDYEWVCAPLLSDVSTSAHTTPIPFHVLMVNTPWPELGPNDGTNVDPPTWAWSMVYLYDMTFTHPATIPRCATDPAVDVGCTLRPPGTPGLNHLELYLWDPADGDYYRKFVGATGNYSPTFTWDGKLYENGVSGTPHYTLASDVFMYAEVFFDVSTPPKAWEESEDSFTEPRYAIIVGGCSNEFAWITPAPAMPALSAQLVSSDANLAPLPEHTEWSLQIMYYKGDRTDCEAYDSNELDGCTWASSAIAAALNGAFRGGDAVMSCYFGEFVSPCFFWIVGQNPDETGALLPYIRQSNHYYWYVEKIARQESSLRQFYASGGAIGEPVMGADPGGTYGWGLFQLTNPRPDPQALWNWHENADRGISLLWSKRSYATSYVSGQRALMHTYCSGRNPPIPDIPIPAQTYGNVTFGDADTDPVDGCTISYNNPGVDLVWWDNNAVPPQWKWKTTGSYYTYVRDVCSQP